MTSSTPQRIAAALIVFAAILATSSPAQAQSSDLTDLLRALPLAQPPSSQFSAALGADEVLFPVEVPNESIGRATQAGAITLLTMTGAGTAGGSVVHQGSRGVPGGNETDDRFGSATAWGDVDGNGVMDLIVGVPGEDVGSIVDAGAITVLYDAAMGTYSRSSILHQGSRGVAGGNETGDSWGFSVASGDLNGDGFDDVLVGAPNEGVGRAVNTGAVTVLFGSARGLTGSGSKLYHQNTPGVPGGNESGDLFGWSVAVTGGISGESMSAAVGAPGEGIGGIDNAGAVAVFETGPGGLVPATPLLYPGNGLDDTVLPQGEGDFFGSTLASDPATIGVMIGAPFATISGFTSGGYIVAYPGPYENGLDAVAVGQDPALAGDFHFFGWSIDVTIGDDGISIAIGAPGTQLAGLPGAGAATIVTNANVTSLHQNSPGVPGSAEEGDFFGEHIDQSPDGTIFIGAAGEDVGSNRDAGAALVLFGTHAAPGSNGIFGIHQDSRGVPGGGETGDFWAS